MDCFSFFNIRRLLGTALAKRPRYVEKMHRIPFTGPPKGDPSPIPTMTIPTMGFASALQCVVALVDKVLTLRLASCGLSKGL